jgi:hypothetical protein
MTTRPHALRRLLGVGLVLLVAVVVPAAARWDGLRTAGSAVVARTVVVPGVGDCVAALTGLTPPLQPLVFGISAAVVDERAVIFAPCVGAHVGEVVASRRDADGVDGGAEERAGAAARWCTDVAVGYREHLRWRVAAVASGVWSPVVAHRFVAVVSGSGADRWAVCAVLAPGLERYRGSYVRSMADLPAPAPFGSCRSGEVPDRRVSCQVPHGQQVFGAALPGATPSMDSCRALVGQLTAMSDPTGDGRLEVGVADLGSAATCRVRVLGPQRLTGTLLGLGDRPLPVGSG